MTLQKAIQLLESEYERAKKIEYVYNPIAYALYKVWRMADDLSFHGERKDNG